MRGDQVERGCLCVLHPQQPILSSTDDGDDEEEGVGLWRRRSPRSRPPAILPVPVGTRIYGISSGHTPPP